MLAELGKPDRITLKDRTTGDWLPNGDSEYVYGRTIVYFSGDSVATVMTRSRTQRTSVGVGVGSPRSAVLRKVPRAHCRVPPGPYGPWVRCYVGTYEPGTLITTFELDPRNRVRRVVLARMWPISAYGHTTAGYGR